MLELMQCMRVDMLMSMSKSNAVTVDSVVLGVMRVCLRG
jgi:hypothetical protein